MFYAKNVQHNNARYYSSKTLGSMSSIHHPTGTTIEIVGEEAKSNGQWCHQHDVCGELIEEDFVLRLRKDQILNAQGKERTAIAAYHVSDCIDQCLVGFLQYHPVAHTKTFDGVLAQVSEIYSAGSESLIKQKRYRHNMGCCLAAIISDFPSAENSISKTTITFLSKIAKQEKEREKEMTLFTRLGGNGESFVSYDDPGASNAVSTTKKDDRNMSGFSTTRTSRATGGQVLPWQQECPPPPLQKRQESPLQSLKSTTAK
jgi:hypothetical protein